MTDKVISFEKVQKLQKERQIFNRWTEFYHSQRHEDLLEALVYEHEHDFPLRRSAEMMDQLRHKALVGVLQEKAQTEFLRSLLLEIDAKSFNQEQARS